MKEREEEEIRGSKARPVEKGKMEDDGWKAETRNPMPRLHRASVPSYYYRDRQEKVE